jgi:hypothetical protein
MKAWVPLLIRTWANLYFKHKPIESISFSSLFLCLRNREITLKTLLIPITVDLCFGGYLESFKINIKYKILLMICLNYYQRVFFDSILRVNSYSLQANK